ncbi:MAG: phenylalanine--tRNA ligase subunit alpha [Bacteroidetes bacterium]|nr:MAG: phenylalanine--tRNA ligase subunit alpha [Bacteroidota bacterium]
MIEKLKSLKEKIDGIELTSAELTEEFRIKYLSRKGLLNDLFEEFKVIANDQKKEVGKTMNVVKQAIQQKWEEASQKFNKQDEKPTQQVDLTLPGEPAKLGSRHPLLLVEKQIVDVFSRLGFSLSYGPEIEDDWHNFSGLNFPENHPARDMQDTFFIDKEMALRTHTSSVQVRLMENQQPPLRAIMPGRVYRNEAISARAHCFFHQVEGIYINKDVSFADLKQTLYHFVTEFFGKDFNIRFRPSYFPFTEPSAEMDISCTICKGKGCNVCKHSGWVEILGCGMIDPNVLDANGIDAREYSGFAFGMGIERITMLKYNVKDLRLFSTNDLRFLQQFEGE